MRWTGVLKHQLELMGFPVVVIAPEDTEPGLLTRRERMNKVAGPAFMFSLHNNAAGMGDKLDECTRLFRVDPPKA
jgi:N-acetylmuramoyl-L-alanine amidase